MFYSSVQRVTIILLSNEWLPSQQTNYLQTGATSPILSIVQHFIEMFVIDIHFAESSDMIIVCGNDM